MAVNTIDAMRQQKQQAESKSNGNGFLLFKISDKQRAMFRPLVNLDQCDVADFHHFFDQTANRYVDAVCANTIGKLCLHCENRKRAEGKRMQDALLAKETFMLPVWLIGVQQKRVDPDTQSEILDENDNFIWDTVTYTDAVSGKEMPVSGLRIIPLAFKRSAYASVADTLLSMHDKGEKITSRDFVIERQGGDQKTKYILGKKQPADFKKDTGDAPKTKDAIRKRILEAFPVAIASGVSSSEDENDPLGDLDEHPF